MFKDKPKKGLAFKRAMETTDDPYDLKVPILSVGETGEIGLPIRVDMKSKDLQAYWRMQEPKLWFIITICAFYFIFVLLTYGV